MFPVDPIQHFWRGARQTMGGLMAWDAVLWKPFVNVSSALKHKPGYWGETEANCINGKGFATALP